MNANWLSNNSEECDYDELIYTSYLSLKSIKFAIGQNPTPITMQYHYRMILENQIEILVAFNDIDNHFDFQVGTSYEFGEVTLIVRSRRQVSKDLIKSEISIIDMPANGVEKIHHAVCFELMSWPQDGSEVSKDAAQLVTSICWIRNEMKGRDSILKVLAHDSRGGVQGACTFVILYDLFQQVDEGLTDENKIKASASTINIFNTVNRIRKDRANAIEDLSTYQILFFCLNHYGPNRKYIQKDVSKKMSSNHLNDRKMQSTNGTSTFEATSLHGNIEMEYVLHDPSYEEQNNIFSDYYDGQVTKAVTYVNIEEMSEYI